MKRTLLFAFLALLCLPILAQDFKFAVISDLLIDPSNPEPLEDLRSVVEDINKGDSGDSIRFVLVLGNITAQGDRASMEVVKMELDKLNMKYYAVSGTNETKWSPSGSTDFSKIFGSERFDFEYEGFRFFGFATGPIVRNMEGHVDVDDIFWLNQQLSKKTNQPTIVATHYPLALNEVDNWYEATDVLRLYNVKAILSGKLRRNIKTTFDNIPAFVNMSTLRDRYHKISSYNIYTVSMTNGKISAAERKVDPYLRPIIWAEYMLGTRYYEKSIGRLKRPDYSINNKYPKIKIVWSRNIFQPAYSSPAMNSNKVFFGDDNGILYAFEADRDNELWRYKSGARIVGTPAATNKVVVFGSADKTIYGLDASSGAVLWQHSTSAAVLGSATIEGNTAYIGGGDGLYALDINSGALKWHFSGAQGHIEAKPLIHNGKVIFGAWDEHLYALNKNDGSLAWKWQSPTKGVRNSPAAVWPVATADKVFFVAPDGYTTALNVENGEQIWRTNEFPGSESIGISEDGLRLYVKTVKDEVLAYYTASTDPDPILMWMTNVGYGGDNSTSMLIEKGGTLYGSTKNGVIFALNGKNGILMWQHKLNNSFIGTVLPVNAHRCYYVTSQGSIGLLEGRANSH